MEAEITPGAIVMLVSGGPRMLAKQVAPARPKTEKGPAVEGSAVCIWFDTTHKLQTGGFPLKYLKCCEPLDRKCEYCNKVFCDTNSVYPWCLMRKATDAQSG